MTPHFYLGGNFRHNLVIISKPFESIGRFIAKKHVFEYLQPSILKLVFTFSKFLVDEFLFKQSMASSQGMAERGLGL